MCSDAIILANSCYVDNWALIFKAVSLGMVMGIFLGVVVGVIVVFLRN